MLAVVFAIFECVLNMSLRRAGSSQGTPVEQASQAAESLVSSAEAAPKPKTRRLVRQDTNKQVHKKLWDHFKGFSDVQKFVLTVDNLTLEERLKRDTKTNRQGQGPPMGAPYYVQLRRMYSLQASPGVQLAATNPTEEVRPDLRDAIRDLKTKPINRGTLTLWLKTSVYRNNRETVGVAKSLLDQCGMKSSGQRDLLLQGMDWFKRNGLHEKDFRSIIR